MARNLFSIPIFFILFRETLEAAIIVSVLLGLAEQIIHEDNANATIVVSEETSNSANSAEPVVDNVALRHRLVRKLRIQIFLGAALGLLIALAIGAAFIAVWFTKASDLWAKSEHLWEGVFELIACLMIFVMGVTMLKMDRAKAKWRVKLSRAFEGKAADRGTKTGKWVLFILPFITVLREGLEAVVFVGGVSLGQPATAIPIAAIVGIICGLVCGFIIYEFASRSTLTIFLIVMTNFLLLIGAGLFSKAVGQFEIHAFLKLLGTSSDDAARDGTGSFLVQGNVWHLDCCNANNEIDGQGWLIFGAIFGWSNNGSLGTILSYVFYWIAVIAVLIYMKFKEGRTTLFGRESDAGVRRRQARGRKELSESDSHEKVVSTPNEDETKLAIAVLPR